MSVHWFDYLLTPDRLQVHNLFYVKIIQAIEYDITVCPGSSYPFYEVIYKLKWVTTSWTHSIHLKVLTHLKGFPI